MMPDKIPTYRLSANYADHSELGSYLRSEWGAGRAFLKGGDGDREPSRLGKLRLLFNPRPAADGARTVRARMPLRTRSD